MNRLREKYNNEIIPSLKEEFHYENAMQIPKLEKIVINMGVGDAAQNSKMLEAAVADLANTTASSSPLISLIVLNTTWLYIKV